MSRFRGVRPVWVPMVAALALMTGVLGLASGAAAAGHTYHVEAVPNPAGASNSALFGISCPMVAGCIAVGYATTSPKSAALVETYAGGTWTPTALHQGFAFPGLEAVWCASMTSCVAVGDVGSLESNGAQPLAETLTDGTWTPTSPPLPETGITGSLDAISCVTTEWCVAGGFFMDSEDNTYSLLEVLSNGTWTPEVGPTPSQSTQSGIRSVRCFTTTSCDAVGFYGISSTYGLLETLSGNEWTASALGGKGILNSLSCVSPGSCLAVGSTVHGGGYTETLSGTTWTRGTLPHPGRRQRKRHGRRLVSEGCLVVRRYRWVAGSPAEALLPSALDRDRVGRDVGAHRGTRTFGIDERQGHRVPQGLRMRRYRALGSGRRSGGSSD